MWSGLAARITLVELCLCGDLDPPALLATGLAWPGFCCQGVKVNAKVTDCMVTDMG